MLCRNVLKDQGRMLTAALVVSCAFAWALPARADVIAGPTLSLNESTWAFSGIGFIANDNSALTGFTYQNQGQADTVELLDPMGTVLDSISIPADNPTYTVSVDWALTAGQQYYLFRTTSSDSLYTLWNQPAPSDTDISLTDTGIFSSQDNASLGFDLGGTTYWSSFNMITTSSNPASAVPEPGSLVLMGLGASALALSRILKKPARLRLK